jgi:hypothetical protein
VHLRRMLQKHNDSTARRTGCHVSSSREGLTAVAGDEESAGARFGATGVATSDANGFENVGAGASSIFGRLDSIASVI